MNVVRFSAESISLWSLSSLVEKVVGRGKWKVTDLLGLLILSDVVVAIEGGSVVVKPVEDDPASSALAVLMGVPSKVVGLGWCFRMGGAVPVAVESSLVD